MAALGATETERMKTTSVIPLLILFGFSADSAERAATNLVVTPSEVDARSVKLELSGPGQASVAERALKPGDQNKEEPTTYPYDLWIGRSVNHVERETNVARVRVEFIRWSDNPYGGRDALFRATNPGNRPVLVWNVRQQVRVSRADGAGKAWETRESDYPGRGWQSATIPAGGSAQSPMLCPTNGEWRVCLLYSREASGSEAPNRRFDGTYESLGPSVREKDEPGDL